MGLRAGGDPKLRLRPTNPHRRTARANKDLAFGGGGTEASRRQIRSAFDAPGVPQMAGWVQRRDQHDVESQRQLGQVGAR